MNEQVLSQLQILSLQMARIEKIMVVVANGGTIHSVSGYSWGRTSDGSPYIILYPAVQANIHKVCRVYEQDWPKLPHYISTNVIAEDAPSDNPTRPNAKRTNRYRNTPAFIIATVPGKETNMGPEVRFFDTIDMGGREVSSMIAQSFNMHKAATAELPQEDEVNDVNDVNDVNHVDAIKAVNQSLAGDPIEQRFYGDGTPVAGTAINYFDDYHHQYGTIPPNIKALRQYYLDQQKEN